MPLIATEGDVDSHSELGQLTAKNPKTVFINNIPVIVSTGDEASPDVSSNGSSSGSDPHDNPFPVEGSPTVFAYGIPIHREDDLRSCGAETYVINQSTVFANGGTGYTDNNGTVFNNPNGYRAVKESYQYVNNGGELSTRDELETYSGTGPIPNSNTGTSRFQSATIDYSNTASTIIVDVAQIQTACLIASTATLSKFANSNTLPVNRNMRLSKYYRLGDMVLDGNWIPKKLTLSTSAGFRTEALTLNGVAGKSEISGDEIICNLQAVAQNILDPIMDRFNNGLPIALNAGFRVPGRKRSEGQHGLGMAIDLQRFSGFTEQVAFDIATWVIANLPFDQLLIEKIGSIPWIHISYNRHGNRLQNTFPNKVGVLYPTTNQFFVGLKPPPYV